MQIFNHSLLICKNNFTIAYRGVFLNCVAKFFMKKLIFFLALASLLPSVALFANIPFWQFYNNENIPYEGKRLLFPEKYKAYKLNTLLLKNEMLAAGYDAQNGTEITLPMPDGNFRTFQIWQTPMMEAPLAEKYPEIKTFTGYAPDNKYTTVKLDFTYKGFHAKIFDGSKTYFIDPFSDANDGFYICYYKQDYKKPEGKYMPCLVGDEQRVKADEKLDMNTSVPKAAWRTNGVVKKTYRLALACTYEYSVAVAGTNPTKANVLSAMVTSMNRVNGVYERELAVTMTLVANDDTLIYITSTDPYSNNSGGAMLNENQMNVDAGIGTANYDIGHVFSTGGGGIANLGCVCEGFDKAMGVTGSPSPLGDPFDIDYVAHEMGHQFGSDHTFNANTGACTGNGEQTIAYEPGSGSTIMAYAGICGGSNDLQNHSDDYFHAISLMKITDYITTGVGANCPVLTPITNIPPVVAPFTASYNIPYLTPFELTAPAVTDADHDMLNYCWEQWNLGNFKSSWSAANLQGPIFRSFDPSTSPTRVFVTPSKLVVNTTSYMGEKLPQDDRFLTFKLTVRDMMGALGTYNIPDDTIHLNVINTGTPFTVTSPNSVVNWTGGTLQTVTWDVAGTTSTPINAANVDIYLSTDGGYTYPFLIMSNTPNDGSELITVPNVLTTNTARIKVKAAGNVFFDISNFNFSITNDPNLPPITNVNTASLANEVNVYPVPASNTITIAGNTSRKMQADIVNTVGQTIWAGNINGSYTLSVNSWSKGVYYLRLRDIHSHETLVKKLLIE